MIRRRRLATALGISLGAMQLSIAHAEIYQWTDADGRVHYTQDLQSVPPEHRSEARDGASRPAAESKVQGFASQPPASVVRARRAFPGAEAAGGARVHRIPVERAGGSMIVPVRLNGRVVAPFVVDTGASYVLVPKAVAEEAGITVGPDTRKLQFGTANGVVEQAVVMLESVELGSATAEDVAASISNDMQIGLLGLSFFNHFTYSVDAANGVLTLVENGLAESGVLRGGRSEAQWRGEFGSMRQRLEMLESAESDAPSTHGRLVAEIEQRKAALERELEQLEAEADEAHVPGAWRQ